MQASCRRLHAERGRDLSLRSSAERSLHACKGSKLEPPCPLSALQGALRAVVERHEILRTRFVERDGEILQAVLPVGHPDAAPRLRKRALPSGSAPGALGELVDELTTRPYQLLGAAPPARFFLLALAPGDAVLLVGMHHILRCGTPARSLPWHA